MFGEGYEETGKRHEKEPYPKCHSVCGKRFVVNAVCSTVLCCNMNYITKAATSLCGLEKPDPNFLLLNSCFSNIISQKQPPHYTSNTLGSLPQMARLDWQGSIDVGVNRWPFCKLTLKSSYSEKDLHAANLNWASYDTYQKKELFIDSEYFIVI